MNRSNALLTMELYANKNYGDSAIIKGDVFASRRKEVYPTGLKQFDAALGVGGIPAGNIIEIHGLENTGKTALALHIVKSFQKRNKKILYVDADRALCIEYMAMCGVTERNIYMLNMDTLEDTFQAIRTLIPVFDLIVIDTLSAIPTKEETAQTGQYLEVQNKSAKILSNEWAHIKHELARYNSTMIVINQMREKVGISWGNPLFALGGRALKAYSTISICMRYMGAEKRQGDIIGQGARADIEKNKCAPPYRSAELKMMYGFGIE